MIFVLDDAHLVPAGYRKIQQVAHGDAAEKLRGKDWSWFLKDEEGETYFRLEALAGDSGVTMDGNNLQCRRVPDSRRLSLGSGHEYLVITYPGLTYRWFSAA